MQTYSNIVMVPVLGIGVQALQMDQLNKVKYQNKQNGIDSEVITNNDVVIQELQDVTNEQPQTNGQENITTEPEISGNFQVGLNFIN